MADAHMLEPDMGFIKELTGLGGGDLKKCYQCATCSVACPISPDTKPFPRKEMIAASWGLKDRLIADHDIWLCHNCGDCTTSLELFVPIPSQITLHQKRWAGL